ncbi:hypothetical protein MSPP1_004201 [Malassezia sp. CBS 17886]|nr:hypothetical protein MSPP1_004201 [Malassezia sp. CBS 17886]
MTVSDTEPSTSERAAPWDSYPSPPSSGRGLGTLGGKRDMMHAYDHGGPDTQNAKRIRGQGSDPRPPAMLTPPSTRGRRIAHKLRGGAPASAEWPPSTSCARYSEAGDTELEPSPSVRKHRRMDPSALYPIRDTLHNPFIEGGPADLGVTGPYGIRARAASNPPRDKGKTVFVFRGQRVVCTDPDMSRSMAHAWPSERPLSPAKPRLLFPPRRSEMSYEVAMRSAHSDDDDLAGPSGAPSSLRGERGLFAQELERRARGSSSALPTHQHDDRLDEDARWLAPRKDAAQQPRPHARPRSAALPRHPTWQPSQPASLPPRNAELLARLEEVDWSTDEERESTDA